MTIGFGGDHSSLDLKAEIIQFTESMGHNTIDFGTNTEESTHYPIYAKKVAQAVLNGVCDLGILICGTGIGMNIAANKIRGIRAAVCSEPFSAKLSKEHNDSNILCIGARVVGSELAKMIVEEWLKAEFLAGRHLERINMFE